MLALALTLASFVPQDPTQEAEERTRTVAAKLAEFGFEIDLDRVAVQVSTKREVREDIGENMSRLMSPDYFEVMTELLHGLGVWTADDADELKQDAVQEMSRQVIAYYQVANKQLSLREEPESILGPLMSPDFIVAHELTHAWRDQQSDLAGLFTEGEPTVEELQIRQCAAEGEAQFVGICYSLLQAGVSLEGLTIDMLANPLDQLLTGPAVLPYTHGSQLAFTLWKEGGWDAVRNIWEDRPSSTEQILHLEKLGRDLPRTVELPEWPLEDVGAELAHDETVGELAILLLTLATGNDMDEKARFVASGWDGDRLHIYRTQTGNVLVWRSVWDRLEDANEFASWLAASGDGLVRVEKNTVDWVRSRDGALAHDVLLALSKPPFEEIQFTDAALTATIEEGWWREGASEPFVTDGRWVHPQCDLSLPVPDGWSQRSLRGMTMLTDEINSSFTANAVALELPLAPGSTLDAVIEQNRTQFETMGLEVLELEARDIAGRPAMWSVATGKIGPNKIHSTSAIFLDGDTQIVVTTTVPPDKAESYAEIAASIYEGLRFGTASFEFPEIEPRAPSNAPRIEASRLVVRDFVTGDALRNVEVFVAPRSSVGRIAAGKKLASAERKARDRGRLFLTNDDGLVTIARSVDEDAESWRTSFWYCARHQDRFGFGQSSLGSESTTLFLGPDKTLAVRVVDGDGKGVRDVPIRLAMREDRFDEIAFGDETMRTRGRRGEAKWHHVFSNAIAQDDLWVELDFPTKQPSRVKVSTEDDLETPLEFDMPETGSLIVRVEGASKPFIGVRVNGRETFYQPEKSGEERSVFPLVEIGLELEVRYDGALETSIVQGPTEPGERKHVTVRVKPKSEDE